MTSKDHFPWPREVAQQCTIFYFYIITTIRNIKFYQLQAKHQIYKYVNWKAKIQTLVLDSVILYSFNEQLFYGPLIQDNLGEPVLSQTRDLLKLNS